MASRAGPASAAQLWIVGPDRCGKNWNERWGATPGMFDPIFGQVKEDVKQDLLMRCRCLALPSRGEGFGLVYLEAMRMGRPCLVSTVDAAREVVNPPEAGWQWIRTTWTNSRMRHAVCSGGCGMGAVVRTSPAPV